MLLFQSKVQLFHHDSPEAIQSLHKIKDHKINLKYNVKIIQLCQTHLKNHNIDWQNTKILDKESRYYSRLMGKMLHIRSNNSAINVKNCCCCFG